MKRTGTINQSNPKKKPGVLMNFKRNPPSVCKNCGGKKIK